MHPSIHARTTPDKIAYQMATSGESVTYAQLEDRSNRFAQLLRSYGIQAGDHIAIFLENHARFFEIAWGAQRAGVIFTAINYRLSVDETNYIVSNCEARLVVSSHQLAATAAGLRAADDSDRQVVHWLMVDEAIDGWESYERATSLMPSTRISDETAANDMLYSSGTTGRPKGVYSPPESDAIDAPSQVASLCQSQFGVTSDSIYLSPAPLYHAAPLRYNMAIMRLGGTSIVMERYDSEHYLQLVEQKKVTHSQLVPTMFVRMLKLEPDVRNRYDVSSLQCVIHAAAPCPVPIKQQMIDWWGPILWEYYAGTEGNGVTLVDSTAWVTKAGTVGKAVIGVLKICDEDGNEVPVGTEGTVYFAQGRPFTYHNDVEKTASSRNSKGWTTLGDVGRVDADGYLFLTDRKAFMIISGGVNIYPQESENQLVTHPEVIDAAVFGVPDADFGEQVKAVVQPRDMARAGPEFEAELIAWCREHIAHHKCPKSVDFSEALPREANGKLYKRGLRDEYWKDHQNRLI
ncbi:MAG: acyl-CoA synthetase [Burkholderiaceae bacterium]